MKRINIFWIYLLPSLVFQPISGNSGTCHNTECSVIVDRCPAPVLSRYTFLSTIIEKLTVASSYLLAITIQYQGAIRRQIHVAEVASRREKERHAEPSCQSPWEKVHRSCVQFVTDSELSWQDARNNCLIMNADLLCINDFQELSKLSFPLRIFASERLSLTEWWIGLRHETNTDVPWMWIDGEPLIPKLLRWEAGEPDNIRSNDDQDNNNLSEDCAILNFKKLLLTKHCESKKAYICEQIKIPTTTTSSTSSPLSSSEIIVPAASSSTKLPLTSSLFDSTTSLFSPTLTINKSHAYTYDKPSTSSQTINSHTDSRKLSVSSIVTSESVSTTDKESQKYYSDDGVITTQDATSTTNVIYTTMTTMPPTMSTIDEFKGCYAINFDNTCPAVEAFGIYWPPTKSGAVALVQCDKGQATWKCNKNPTCWHEEPDVKQCTSDNIQELTQMLDEYIKDPNNSKKAVTFAESLVATIANDSPLSEQDLFQSTKLLLSMSMVKPHNSSDAKKIMQNVIKCGSSLVSNDRSNTWTSMKIENQRTIASSLLISMESVVVDMLNKFTTPTTETINEENLIVQLNVVDVATMTSSTQDIAYHGGSNYISIPPENVKKFSTGGLAHIAFMDYFNIQDFLTPEAESVDSEIEIKVVSRVVSASIGDTKDSVRLLQPITFTLKTDVGDNKSEQQLCSFWNFNQRYTGAWSQKGCRLVSYNGTHTTCQCNHLTNFAVLMDIHKTKITEADATTLSYITYVGIITSIVCLFLSWITFVCLSSLQGERNSIHINLVFCLLVAEIVFLAGIERTDNKVACAVIAACLHYFFLCTFTWMFIEGIHILFMLVQVFDAAKSRLKYYYLIGYACPLITVAVSAAVFYQGYGTEKYCWLTTERMFIWSFAGPVALILLVNLFVLIYAMSAVCKHSEYVFTNEKSKSENIRAWIQGALAIEVLLGLTWAFGYFYVSENFIVMAYLFTVFNSLQGVFIFVCHCLLNKKVWKEYKIFISYKKMSSLATTNSSSKYGDGSGPNTDSSLNMTSCRKQSNSFEVNKHDRRQSTRSATLVA